MKIAVLMLTGITAIICCVDGAVAGNGNDDEHGAVISECASESGSESGR